MKLTLLAFSFFLAATVPARHQHHAMTMDATGMVMNQNHHTLPRGCEAVSDDFEFTIKAGSEYAADTPGMVFGMSQHEVRVQPCSRVTITFVNEDEVRHQWMVHGLPAYLYPQSMFHIEANGGATQTGTFITPADERTYLIHCDMSQHMEKGMKGQLVVGRGSGNLWSVKDAGQAFTRAAYLPDFIGAYLLVTLLLAAAAVVISRP